jgi:hypothetical protein
MLRAALPPEFDDLSRKIQRKVEIRVQTIVEEVVGCALALIREVVHVPKNVNAHRSVSCNSERRRHKYQTTQLRILLISKRDMAAEHGAQRQSNEKHVVAFLRKSLVLDLNRFHPIRGACLRHVFHLRAVAGQKDSLAAPVRGVGDGLRHRSHL